MGSSFNLTELSEDVNQNHEFRLNSNAVAKPNGEKYDELNDQGTSSDENKSFCVDLAIESLHGSIRIETESSKYIKTMIYIL